MNDKQQTVMTPELKARELVYKFYTTRSKDDLPLTMYWSSAIGCALIAVDEIIDSRDDDRAFCDTLSSTSSEYYTPHPMYLTYWQQVKQEIEKL